jgi:hypothetical protein
LSTRSMSCSIGSCSRSRFRLICVALHVRHRCGP